MTAHPLARRLALLACALVNAASAVQAADPATDLITDPTPKPGEVKLTLGRYHLGGAGGGGGVGSDASNGTDLNLRYRQGSRTVWLGAYQDANTTRQWRAGWDDQWDVPTNAIANAAGPAQVLPSLQVASGGFVGGSMALQVGAPFYAQVGLGRTNLRPYANLNFDPNDALMATLGWQGEGGRQAALAVIADDRLGTGQQHTT